MKRASLDMAQALFAENFSALIKLIGSKDKSAAFGLLDVVKCKLLAFLAYIHADTQF
jgi:hypothetical protein